jgi:hypothetical protein
VNSPPCTTHGWPPLLHAHAREGAPDVNQLREFFSESSKRAAGALSARLDRPDDGPPLAGDAT